MKIIISPAKKMNVDPDTLPVSGLPRFLDRTERLMKKIQSLSYGEAKALWRCNDSLAELNYRRFQEMDLEKNLTPAALSYEGLQYQHMAPRVLTESALKYISGRLRILSGFYGILAPFEGVVPYRLEMQARLSVDESGDLYNFWGNRIYSALLDEDRTVVNLASKEYSRAVEKYLTEGDRFITVEFGEFSDGRLKQNGNLCE